jgi:hypothetical protein
VNLPEEGLIVANELESSPKMEVFKRLLLSSGALIMFFLIAIPTIHMKPENSPLAIALTISALISLALGVFLYYRPKHCVYDCERWLPPFNTAIIGSLIFTTLLWTISDFSYDVRGDMGMMLSVMMVFFMVSEGTYLWEFLG